MTIFRVKIAAIKDEKIKLHCSYKMILFRNLRDPRVRSSLRKCPLRPLSGI